MRFLLFRFTFARPTDHGFLPTMLLFLICILCLSGNAHADETVVQSADSATTTAANEGQ